jgi:excisionase family DNA binding protein
MATTLPRILTLPEVATLLRLSPGVVIDLAEAGKIPGQRQGDHWQFLRDEVETWSARYDQRKVLLRQVGALAHDETIEALQTHVDQQRQANTLDTVG